MKTIFTTVFCLTLAMAFAQPVITSDWIDVGANVIVSSVPAESAPDPGPSGANVTWDFSAVTTSDTAVTGFFTFGLPDTTPYFGSFPESNVVQLAIGEEFYQYWKLSGSELENLGVATTGLEIVYSDPVKNAVFPMTYQTTFSDTYEGAGTVEFEMESINVYFSGSSENEVDGYGTLILPDATIENVLRLKSITNDVDSVDLGLGITSVTVTTTESYTWVTTGYPAPLANYSSTSGYSIAKVVGIPLDTTEIEDEMTFSFSPGEIMVGTSDVRLVENLGIYPNPVDTYIGLHLTLETDEAFDVRVYDIGGQLIQTHKIQAGSGQHSERLSAPGLPGTYLLELSNARGRQAVPFIVK